jgi:hypothetical protein
MTAARIVRLSQPEDDERPSKRCPRASSSIEVGDHLAGDEARLQSPSVPIVIPSEIAMVLNSIGVPPPADPLLHLRSERAVGEVARHGPDSSALTPMIAFDRHRVEARCRGR